MKNVITVFSICFSAGAMGGLFNALIVWMAGSLAITNALGVSIAPGLSPDMIYTRTVWGGLWGFLFLIPLTLSFWPVHKWIIAGLLLSLGPSAATLFYFMPISGAGMLGLMKGELTPLFVLIFNAVWGVVAAYIVKKSNI